VHEKLDVRFQCPGHGQTKAFFARKKIDKRIMDGLPLNGNQEGLGLFHVKLKSVDLSGGSF
jgi:hypothetical protein